MIELLTLTSLLLTTNPSPEPEVQPQLEQRDGPRIRWGIGPLFVADEIILQSEFLVPEVGLATSLGLQVNDYFGVYALVQTSNFLIFASTARAEVLAELTTLNGRLSLATGAAVASSAVDCLVPRVVCWDEKSAQGTTTSAGVPARLTVNFGKFRNGNHRHRFFTAIDGYAGLNFNRQGFLIKRGPEQRLDGPGVMAYQLGLGLGYQMM